MYEELYQYLDETHIGEADIDSLLVAINADIHLREKIVWPIRDEIQRVANLKFPKHEFRCGIEHQSLSNKMESDADLIVKKLVSLTTTRFVHCGLINEYAVDVHDGYSLSWSDIGS